MLGKCSRCGKPWLNVFCTATSATGYERVTPADAEAMLGTTDPSELKKFMRQWGDRNL